MTTPKPADLQEALAGLRGDFSLLAACLEAVSHTVACPQSAVELRLHHPTFQSGAPAVYELARGISHFLTHFALHRTECERVARLYGKVPVDKYDLELSILKQQAKDTFKKAQTTTKRNGEAGELLLFLLTEWQLGAPQILAKLSLKTNPLVSVHGSDGIHLAYREDTGQLLFYFGESKVHADLNSAISDAAASIAKSLQPAESDYELSLVARHLPLSGLSANAQEAILSYLHPFSLIKENVEKVITGLICYNDPTYDIINGSDTAICKTKFQENCVVSLGKIADKLAKALKANGVVNQRVELFLIPFPSVSDFRDHFQDEIGWKA